MKRLTVFALAIAGVIGVVPATSGALPPDLVAPPNSIIGTVTDEQGRPLPDIMVTDTSLTTSASTDLDGSFLLENLVAGTEYTLMTNDPAGNFLAGQSQPVTVSDVAGVRADIVLQRAPTTRVSGTVRDVNGVPLVGIRLSESQQGFHTFSGADGTFAFDGIRSDLGLTITATDPNGLHSQTFTNAGPVQPDGSTVIHIVMADEIPMLAGTVTDPAGLPVEGVSVSILEFGMSTATGPDGRFVFGGFSIDGTFTLSVDPRFVRPDLRPVDTPVTLVSGVSVNASVQLSRVATIDVTVTAGGAPAEAQVTVWSTNGESVGTRPVGADGRVTIPIFNDGQYLLQVESTTRGYASEFYPNSVFRAAATRFTIAGEQHVPVQVALEREAIISGTITMSNGSPGDYTQVVAVPVGAAEGEFAEIGGCNVPNDSDPPGTFRIACLHPSATWLIKGVGFGVSADGYYRNSQSAFNATRIPVRPGQTVKGIALRLPPKTPDPTFIGMSQTYFVTGTTTRGVRIYGTNFPRDFHALLLTAQPPFFGTPTTTITITGVINSNEAVATVTVASGAVGDFPLALDCQLRRAIGGSAGASNCLAIGDATTKVGTISGKVTDNRGRAVSRAVISLNSADGSFFFRTLVTGADGSYSAPGLPTGSYTVRFNGTEALNGQYWKGASGVATSTPVTVTAGRTTRSINAQLTRRGPITATSVSPAAVSSSNIEFDLIGSGFSPIAGGFQVLVDPGFGLFPLDVQAVSDTTLHARLQFFLQGGSYDVVLQWTGDNGTTKRTTCVKCLTVIGPLFISGVDGSIVAGTTSTLTLSGSGITGITDVTIDGTGITVDSFSEDGLGNLLVTVTATADATQDPFSGSLTLTVWRSDGSATQVFLFLETQAGAPV